MGVIQHLLMRPISPIFTSDNLTAEDALKNSVLERKFHSPTYLGKLKIEPKEFRKDTLNLFEACGSSCYVFGFTFWETYKIDYNEFYGEPGHLFRRIGSVEGFILIGDYGTFIYTLSELINTFYFANCPERALFRFIEYNEDGKYWKFECISDFQWLEVDRNTRLSRLVPDHLDPTVPCPEEVYKKFSFISRYMNKSYLGAEIQITPKMQSIVQAFAKNSIISARPIETYHFALVNRDVDLKIFDVDATMLLLNNSPDPDQCSAIYINDFPGFDNHGTDHRIPALWMYGPCPGGYDHYEYEPFFKIAFEGKLRHSRGTVISVSDENIQIHIDGLGLKKFPLNELPSSDEIKRAFLDDKVIDLKVLCYFIGTEQKFKFTDYKFD